MATGSQALTSSWWTAADWIDDRDVVFTITGTGAVEYLWEIGTPATAASGAPIAAGSYSMRGPLDGYKVYFKVTSGSATVYYSKSSETTIEFTKAGYGYSGGAGSDEAFALSQVLQVGFDDLTTRTAANPYEFAAYLPTVAAGLASGSSVTSAYAMLRLGQWTIGRTLRIYGIKYATDQSANITDWDTLQNRTKTTAYTDVTLSVSEIVTVNITSIITELQAVSGWDTTSPVQLYVKDTGSYANDLNTLATIDASRSGTQISILLTSGLTPVPAEPL
jgi:hypothetical protein